MKVLIIGLVLLTASVYAAPVFACDCDTAAAITGGMQDRLHQPWPNDPELSKQKQKNPDNAPKQESQPTNRALQSGGEVQKQEQTR